MEKYFRFGNFHGLERLQLISLSLEGHVLNWFNGEMENDPFIDWMQFKQRLVARFRQCIEDEPGKRWFSLKQTGVLLIMSKSLRSCVLLLLEWMNATLPMCSLMD